MRFNPDHDPNPSRDKFKTIDSFDDLPEEAKESLTEHFEQLTKMMDADAKSNPGGNPIITTLAFTQFQIHAIQQEIANIHKMLITLAQAIDGSDS